jgi:predicted nicotinamide N-methyase
MGSLESDRVESDRVESDRLESDRVESDRVESEHLGLSRQRFTFGEHALTVRCRKSVERTTNFKLTVQVSRRQMFESLVGFGGSSWSSSDEEEGCETSSDLDLLGLDVWPAAMTLCEYIAQHPDLVRNKRVIELGAGVGLPGLVAGKVGASEALITDYDAQVVARAHENAVECGLENVCRGVIVDWKTILDEELKGSFDVVLAADVMYMSSIVGDFVRTMAACMKPGTGRLLLTHQCRHSLVDDGGELKVVDRDVSFETFREEVARCGGLALEILSEAESEGFPGPMYIIECNRTDER